MMLCVMSNFSMIDKMEPITLTIGVDRYVIHPLDLLVSCTQTAAQNATVTCSALVLQSDKDQVIGIPFFNSNLVVFDKARRRVGTV